MVALEVLKYLFVAGNTCLRADTYFDEQLAAAIFTPPAAKPSMSSLEDVIT